jgi:hypothetical protein
VVVALVLVLFALVGWVVAGRIVGHFAPEEPPGAGPADPVDGGPGAAEPAARSVPAPPMLLLAPPAAVPRPVRRCGNCRVAGHTRPACPRLTGALPLPHL